MTNGVTSKTTQGKTRKSTSLKTGGTSGIDQSEQIWALNGGQVQMQGGQPGSHNSAVYQNVEQYN